MSESAENSARRTPWHIWVIGVVSLLWNAVGAFDYIMTETKNEAYMSQFTPEQLAFFYGLPAWVVAFWAIAVWGGVVGSILLLLRKRLAVTVFIASLVSVVITTVHNYVFANGLEVMEKGQAIGFSLLIFLIALGLVIYSNVMAKRGVIA